MVKASNVPARVLRRFWDKVQINHGPDACWLWTGCRVKGYGTFYFHGRSHRAHRVSHTLLVGEIPDGLVIDHLCRNKACVNPRHIEAVTQRENVVRGDSPRVTSERLLGVKRPSTLTHCVAGHEYTPENTYVRARTGWRECRTCIRENQRSRRAANRE